MRTGLASGIGTDIVALVAGMPWQLASAGSDHSAQMAALASRCLPKMPAAWIVQDINGMPPKPVNRDGEYYEEFDDVKPG